MFIPEAYASEANDCQIVLGLPVLLLAVYVCKQLKINLMFLVVCMKLDSLI